MQAFLSRVLGPTTVERGSSAVERQTHNLGSTGSNPPLLPFRSLGIFILSTMPQFTRLNNEYLGIDAGGNVSDLVLVRNCCMARMLPGEAELVSE